MSTTIESPLGAPASPSGVPVAPHSAAFRPVSINDVTITGGFWKTYQDLNHNVTLGHADGWLERTGWLGNFDRVADGTIGHSHAGREFADSEIYKYLEALSWEYGRTKDPAINARIEEIAAKLEAAQDEDGYLNTNFGHEGQPARYTDLEWGHELYCYGHLLQAAVARLRTYGEDILTRVSRRVADHIVENFGPDGNQGVCGHAEIEVALAEFGRATGEAAYVDQAKLFVDRRGHHTLKDIEFGREYYQDDVPVREARTSRGHSVRAMYLAAGALDVADETGDTELAAAVRTQWDNTLARRTYVTGGMGSHHQDEAFGEDFELPSDRAYSETCAGIGSAMVAWRLLLQDGQAKEADHIERVLHNVVATALADTGDAFFYTNTLHQRVRGRVADPNEISPRAHASLRAPWFEVSCCPTNIARTIASFGAYVASTRGSEVQVHQYPSAAVSTLVDSGVRAAFTLDSELLETGRVRVVISDDSPAGWDLSLRVPAWARNATLTRGGSTREIEPGYVSVSGPFEPGEIIELDFGHEPIVLTPDPRIDAIRGSVAVQVGPQIYCLESVDLPDDLDVDDVAFTGELLSGGSGSAGAGTEVRGTFRVLDSGAADWPYRTDATPLSERTVSVPLRPYSQWGNRGPATMRIWLPVVS